MSLKYDLYTNPPDKDGKKSTKQHARVAKETTINTRALARQVQENYALTAEEVEMSLKAVIKEMGKELANGYKVHIDGLGYFQLSLSVSDRHSGTIRSEYVKVKTVTFRPEAAFKKKFSALKPKRVSVKRNPYAFSEEEMLNMLDNHFKEHPYITASSFCRMFHFTKSVGRRYLMAFVADGKLKKTGPPRFPVYEPVITK